MRIWILTLTCLFGMFAVAYEGQLATPPAAIIPQAPIQQPLVNKPPSQPQIKQNIAPQNIATQNIATQNIAPQNVVPQNVIPQNTASQNIAPQNVVPQNIVPQNVMPQNIAPQNVPIEVMTSTSPSTAAETYSSPTIVIEDAASNFSKRVAFSGNLLLGTSGSSNRFVNVNLATDFGWVIGSVELGPFLQLDTPDENLKQSYRFTDYTTDLRFFIGFFGEFRLNPFASVGGRVSYGRAQNRNLVQLQPYATLKYFASQSVAMFISLAPYYSYKLDGGSEWGIQAPVGLRLYF